jgi:hypothetical protein
MYIDDRILFEKGKLLKAGLLHARASGEMNISRLDLTTIVSCSDFSSHLSHSPDSPITLVFTPALV